MEGFRHRVLKKVLAKALRIIFEHPMSEPLHLGHHTYGREERVVDAKSRRWISGASGSFRV